MADIRNRIPGFSGIPSLTLIQILEHQLMEHALGDCAGFSVLDLGGGDGFHARHAVKLGATAVDVVDSKLFLHYLSTQIGLRTCE